MSPDNTYSLRAHAIESLTQVKRPNVPWRVVVRNTAAVVLPLAVGMATGHQTVGLAVASGALNGMFSDQPGPYRQRLRQLLLNALAAGLASLAGFLLGAHLLPLLVVAAAFGLFGGLLVVFGPDTARAGMTSMILLVITAASPQPLTDALGGAALIFSGGLLLAAFSLAAWPLQRYWPERHALVEVYRGLSTLARETRHDATDAPALSEAVTALQQTLLGRHRAHGRAMEAFGVLLELAERIRLELIAIGELHNDPALHARTLDTAAAVLDAIADALQHGDSPTRADALLRARHETAHGPTPHRDALFGQLAAAVRNADWAGSRGELRASAAETQLPATLRSAAIRATLRASLTPRSAAFRHAVRMAVCLVATLAVSRWLHLPHGYWLPMTTAIVLRADFAATFSFGLLRVVGTVLGLLLTTVLLSITPAQPWAHLLLMAVLCMAFRYLAAAHYGIAVAALTGTVVILLSFEGVAPDTAVLDRVVNTALGCGVALLAYVIWPTWERGRARTALSSMLDAYAGYLAALASPGHREARAHQEARTAARTARINAQASLERMRAEPATPPALLELANALFANGNRLARTAMSFEAWLDEEGTLPELEAGCRFVGSAAEATRTIAEALRNRHAPGELPDLRSMQRDLARRLSAYSDHHKAQLLIRIGDRLVDNVDTLAHITQRNPQATARDDRQEAARLPV